MSSGLLYELRILIELCGTYDRISIILSWNSILKIATFTRRIFCLKNPIELYILILAIEKIEIDIRDRKIGIRIIEKWSISLNLRRITKNSLIFFSFSRIENMKLVFWVYSVYTHCLLGWISYSYHNNWYFLKNLDFVQNKNYLFLIQICIYQRKKCILMNKWERVSIDSHSHFSINFSPSIRIHLNLFHLYLSSFKNSVESKSLHK